MTNSDHERVADLKTIQAMADVKAGRSEPIDDLLLMIDEDKNESVGQEIKIVALRQALIEGEESGFAEYSLEKTNRDLDEEGLA